MIGIDEVGRGCWAGPLLVVAARITGTLPNDLRDSKKLSRNKREKLYLHIEETCDVGMGWVYPVEIDQIGLTEAMRLAVHRALTAIEAKTDEEIIMDGSINYCSSKYMNVTCVVKADDLHPIVSAASVYAKVSRDRYMTEMSADYPGYGFADHVGYGTKAHIEALRRLGVTDVHRKSYKPIRLLMAQE